MSVFTRTTSLTTSDF